MKPFWSICTDYGTKWELTGRMDSGTVTCSGIDWSSMELCRTDANHDDGRRSNRNYFYSRLNWRPPNISCMSSLTRTPKVLSSLSRSSVQYSSGNRVGSKRDSGDVVLSFFALAVSVWLMFRLRLAGKNAAKRCKDVHGVFVRPRASALIVRYAGPDGASVRVVAGIWSQVG